MNKYIFPKTAILILTLLLGMSCSTINKSHINQSVKISIEAPMKAKIDVDLTRKLVGYAFVWLPTSSF